MFFAVDAAFPIESIRDEVGYAGILRVDDNGRIETMKRARVLPIHEMVSMDRIIFTIARRLYWQLNGSKLNS